MVTTKVLVARVTAAAAVGLLLAGCGNSDPSPTTPTTPTTPTAATTAAPAVGTDGPPSAPITWELDDVASSDAPVEALQRYLAYDTYITSLPESDRDGADATVLASGYERVATGEKLDNVVRNTKAYARGTVRTGPLWIRLSTQSSDDARTQLIACSDRRYNTYTGATPNKDQRPFALAYTLRKTTDGWKVSRSRTAPKTELSRCRSWDISRHTPDAP